MLKSYFNSNKRGRRFIAAFAAMTIAVSERSRISAFKNQSYCHTLHIPRSGEWVGPWRMCLPPGSTLSSPNELLRLNISQDYKLKLQHGCHPFYAHSYPSTPLFQNVLLWASLKGNVRCAPKVSDSVHLIVTFFCKVICHM